MDKITGYYSLRELLGYNAKYNLVLSERGPGKTYGTKLFLMDKEDETAMCIYREGNDIESAMGSWIDPLVKEGYVRDDFKWKGNTKRGYELLYQGEPRIWFRALAQVNRVKHEYFPDNMNWVWWDEFIPLNWKKLAGIDSEADALRTIVKTVEHDTVHTRVERGLKPVRVLMYANPLTWDNPVLADFGVNPFKGFGVHRAGPDVVFELLKPLDKEVDRAEKWLGDDVHKNMGWMNETSFVSPIPKGAVPEMSIRVGEKYFVVYHKNKDKWVKRVDKHSSLEVRRANGKVLKLKFGTLDGLREDEICLNDTAFAKRLKDERMKGTYNYPDLNTKFEWLNALETL